jgi:hypothetical protein
MPYIRFNSAKVSRAADQALRNPLTAGPDRGYRVRFNEASEKAVRNPFTGLDRGTRHP